jgi:hypothetical protein
MTQVWSDGRVAQASTRDITGRRGRLTLRLSASLLFGLLVLGSGAMSAAEQARRHYAMAVAGYSFDIVGWEFQAIGEKTRYWLGLGNSSGRSVLDTDLPQTYLAQARRIGELESQLASRSSEVGLHGADLKSESVLGLSAEVAAIRQEQGDIRPVVEAMIQEQVSSVLLESGFGLGSITFPPVQFTFTEPPKKLVVSRRNRIDVVYTQMLDGDIPIGQIEIAERTIGDERNSSAYITNIGGLGAYPAMVVDRAGMEWVLSTVAHEWVHNYLVMFPLGWSYFSSHDLTTINETVAEIVGDEIGSITLARYYPELVPPPQPRSRLTSAPGLTQPSPPEFDFVKEMRETRLEVDRLLDAGKVREAEGYMADRREEFVANGHRLRVLNQAYFAFHGSYGTSAASTSPIGPKLEALRHAMPDLVTFLSTVRWFTSVDDLDRALTEWQSAPRS